MTPEAMARRLRDGLKRKNKLTHAVRLGPWAREFAALCAQVGAPRCARVLEWYCTNLRRKFVPRAYSAGAFRGKFLRIEDAMVRTPVPLTISAEAWALTPGPRAPAPSCPRQHSGPWTSWRVFARGCPPCVAAARSWIC
jgi:hypothetical protein